MPRDVRGPEDHRRLTAGRCVGRVRVDEHEIEEVGAHMLADHSQVVLHAVAVRLARLSGEVADIELESGGGLDRFDHTLDQEIGKDRGVQGARADDDQLCVQDRLRGFGVDLHAVGLQEDMADRRVLLGDLRLALDGAAVDRRHQRHVSQRRRQDGAFHREHLSRFAERLLEVSRHVRHRHDEKVPEGVAVEGALLEAMVEELLHQRLGVGECDQALAEVTGREDSILVAQPDRRAAVVGNRHDRGEIGRVGLQAAEQRAESGAAPDRDDARPASAKPECVDDLDNASRVRPGKERSEHRLREL